MVLNRIASRGEEEVGDRDREQRLPSRLLKFLMLKWFSKKS